MHKFKKVFLIFTLLVFASNSHSTLPEDLINGDKFYEGREDINQAYQALALYEKHLDMTPNSIDALWRASMANYYVGHLLKEKKKRVDHYKKGINQGKLCNSLSNEKKVECLFWLATNNALLKKENGIFSLAFGIGSIIKIFEKALKVDSTYAGSGPYRMLSLLYKKAPGFLGGDEERSFTYIKKAMEQSPDEPLNYYFYIKFLMEEGKEEEALKVANTFTSSHEKTVFSYFESRNAFKNIMLFLETKELPKDD